MADVRAGRVNLEKGDVIVVMRYYPRFVRKELITRYLPELAPPAELLREFKEHENRLGDHNQAFMDIDFAKRFQLSPTGWELLDELSEQARSHDVFLVCQCSAAQRCHCDLLLQWAKERFQAPIS